MKNFNGSCHCGKITWKASLPIKTVVQCYCQNCRRLQGSDYSNWIVLAKEQFIVTNGEQLIARYQFNERSEKNFCSCCGTVIYGVNGKHFPENRLVSLGTVDHYDEHLKPLLLVYTDNKAPWL